MIGRSKDGHGNFNIVVLPGFGHVSFNMLK